jgi:hypothetical protein
MFFGRFVSLERWLQLFKQTYGIMFTRTCAREGMTFVSNEI